MRTSPTLLFSTWRTSKAASTSRKVVESVAQKSLVIHPTHHMLPKAGTRIQKECSKCWTCTCHGGPELEEHCVPVVIPPRNNIAKERCWDDVVQS